jgi:hypothetical protein
MRCGSTITLQKANARVWNGNIQRRHSKRSSKSTINEISDIDTFWDPQGQIQQQEDQTKTKDNIPPIEEATERKPYGLRIF